MGRFQQSKSSKKNMRPINKRSENYKTRAEFKKKCRKLKKQKGNNKMEKKYLIGFYGDYRKNTKGYSEIINKTNCFNCKGVFYTEPEYSLYEIKKSMDSGLIKGNHSIFIEVYEINQNLLDTLDIINGYDEINFKTDNYYNRIKINSPFGEIEVYFWNAKITDEDTLIEDGDWLDYISSSKLKQKILQN